jgi:uncharacterized repeat protein (TIGR03843 family)
MPDRAPGRRARRPGARSQRSRERGGSREPGKSSKAGSSRKPGGDREPDGSRASSSPGGAGGRRGGRADPGEAGGGRPGRPDPGEAGGGRPRANPRGPAEGRRYVFSSVPPDDDGTLALLARGTLEVEGRLIVATNATLYCTVVLDGRSAACVYKPVAGERPLWDFPPGTLAGREVAAYAVSRAAGWDLVPPTVMRDGPFGPGMCQLWIDADISANLVSLARSRDHAPLRDMAVFDAVVNNADRKIGHLLPVNDGRLYGCDHGVCFGEEYKLRTVLWQWRGEELPARALTALAVLKAELASGALADELSGLLSGAEIRATRNRVDMLIKHRIHPYPPENWPAVPWPPV